MTERIGSSGKQQQIPKDIGSAKESSKIEAKPKKQLAPVPENRISIISSIPEKHKPVDSAHPNLPLPLIKLTEKEAIQKEKDIKNKLTKRIPPNVYAARVAQGSEELKKRLETTKENVIQYIKNKDSFGAMMAIQELLVQTSNISAEIGGKILEDYGRQQIKQKEKSDKLIKDQEAAATSYQKSALASKILGWFTSVVNLIGATIAVASAVTAAGVTAGAASPALLPALAWLSGAVMGITAQALDEAGTLKDTNVQWLGLALSVTGTVLSLGGFAVTGGIASTIEAGTAGLQKLQNVVAFTVKSVGTIRGAELPGLLPILFEVSQPVAQITSAFYKKDVDLLNAETVGIEKVQNEITSMINSQTQNIMNVLKAINEHFLKSMTINITDKFRTIAAIQGNI